MNTAAPALDFAKAREMMVEQQVRPWDVLDVRVLEVLARLPREDFVPVAYRALAYADMELPLAHGQNTLKPVFEGRALQSLLVQPTEDVLEIGTGCGYLTACLAALSREVVSVERYEDLAQGARTTLASQHVANARVATADVFDWDPGRRFDAICVGAAVDTVPARFVEWLKPGGRMLVVRGRAPAMEAVLVRNEVNGPRIESLFETDLPYLAGAAPAPEFTL